MAINAGKWWRWEQKADQQSRFRCTGRSSPKRFAVSVHQTARIFWSTEATKPTASEDLDTVKRCSGLFFFIRREWRHSHFDAAGESFHDTSRLYACGASQEDAERNGRIGLLPFKLEFQLLPVKAQELCVLLQHPQRAWITYSPLLKAVWFGDLNEPSRAPFQIWMHHFAHSGLIMSAHTHARTHSHCTPGVSAGQKCMLRAFRALVT